MPTPDWFAWQRQVDSLVDQQWSEEVELHPMLGGEESVGEIQSDPNRSILRGLRAVVESPGARATGMNGTIAIGVNTREAGLVTGQWWLSITEEQIGSYKAWKAYDKVYLVERNLWFTISHIPPVTDGRVNVYMTFEPDMNV